MRFPPQISQIVTYLEGKISVNPKMINSTPELLGNILVTGGSGFVGARICCGSYHQQLSCRPALDLYFASFKKSKETDFKCQLLLCRNRR